MKKLIIGLLAAVLMGSGLVAFTSATSTAAPYPGTVVTLTDAGGPHRLRSGGRPRTAVKVVTAGNARPTGKLIVSYKRRAGGFSATKTFAYGGGSVEFRGPRLRKRGRYGITVRYVPPSGSVFKSSIDSYSLRVVRR